MAETRICKMCQKPFEPTKRTAVFCCRECGHKYHRDRYTLKRSKERQRRTRETTRICPVCGRSFAWSKLVHNKTYCSPECKREYETRERRANAERRDSYLIDYGGNGVPVELEKLRETKGKAYYLALFNLPKESQFAEMATWTNEDHMKAVRYCGAEHVFEVDGDDYEEDETTDDSEPFVEDEENMVCDIYSDGSRMRGM